MAKVFTNLYIVLLGQQDSSVMCITLRVKPTARGFRFCVQNIPETPR